MKKRRVLVADDSITIQKLVNLSLASRGFEIITASDGLDAEMKVRRLKPDLILLDSGLRQLNVQQMFDDIRQDPELLESRLILLYEAGDDFFDDDRIDTQLRKPFDASDLEQTVEQVFNEEKSTLIQNLKEHNLSDEAEPKSEKVMPEPADQEEAPAEIRGPFREHTEASMSDRLSAIAQEVAGESHSSPKEPQNPSPPPAKPLFEKHQAKAPTAAELSRKDLEEIARKEIKDWIDAELPSLAEKLVKEAFLKKSQSV